MSDEISILSACTSGGCGAKIGPGELAGLLSGLPVFDSPRLLVGYHGADDAAVYQLEDGSCLISTADFFSPMVEDARSFGRIAAANAMSDVWAMGGQPVLALNLVCFPEALPKSMLADILAGGAEKIQEAGAVLGGGHSIYDKEPKYGLAVTGLAAKESILHNNTPCVGDALILTKPLGVGIVMAAARAGLAGPGAMGAAVASMERLNGYAAAHMARRRVHACTDVTGFGLLAHLWEMLAGSASARIRPGSLPIISEAAAYAEDFLLTAAGQRNRTHMYGAIPGLKETVDGLPFAIAELMFDPQTSGGLVISVDPADAAALLADIQTEDPHAAIIGSVGPASSAPFSFEE